MKNSIVDCIPFLLNRWIQKVKNGNLVLVILFFAHLEPLLAMGKAPVSEPSIVFVHLGPTLPEYLPTALSQARLFNPEISIYLLANESAIKNKDLIGKDSNIKLISCESLQKSFCHKKFITRSTLNKTFRNGFWFFTTERFFYLAAFLKQYRLVDVFHLENDVMLYANLNELLPLFKKNYHDMIAATFDNDHRCIPGFLYISNAKPLEHFLDFITQKKNKSSNDMEAFSRFQQKYQGQWIDHLPILIPEYSKDHELISSSGSQGSHPNQFSNHFEQFHSIFDAAAIGQYLGGIDPRNGVCKPGFINEECIFNPTHFTFHWQEDDQGRKIPLITYQGSQWKINNLHIHSKNLKQFKSKNDQ